MGTFWGETSAFQSLGASSCSVLSRLFQFHFHAFFSFPPFRRDAKEPWLG